MVSEDHGPTSMPRWHNICWGNLTWSEIQYPDDCSTTSSC